MRQVVIASYEVPSGFKKISKESFYKVALTEGLCMLGAKGIKLEQAKTMIDNALATGFDYTNLDRIKCTKKGNRIYRGISSLTLDNDDTVYVYKDFYIVHTFTAAGNGANFDSFNTIIYC